MKALNKHFALTVLKRILDLGIGVYLILIPIIIVTGGFKVDLLGISIKAHHIYTPLRFLVPLILIRLIITVEIKSFILLLCSVFVSLLGAELALRIWNPPMAKPHMAQIHRASPIFDWELVPGSSGIGGFGETYRINSAGFRDIEHERERRPGIFRIMVIGDSFTFGPSVNLEDTYPKQLERILKDSHIRCEVINCGVIGYDMWQHFEMLKRKVLPHQPDLVILGLFLNDITDPIPPYKKGTGQWKGTNPFEPEGPSEIMKHFSLWNYLWNLNYWFETKYRYRRGHAYLQGIEKRKQKFGPGTHKNKWRKIMVGKLEKQEYEEFKEALNAFVVTAKSGGASVLVAMIPDAAQLHDPGKQAVNRFLERSCLEAGAPFVDTTPGLEKQKDPRPLYLFPKDPHNSPKGYRLIAQTIADKIRKNGLLTSQKRE
ncbi:MAG: hypothetical protein GY849_03420 [Deltaproteobacteria bacterium]|nr:hypothetical protein [Deltaproteobacteria bacterium]